MKSFQTPVCDRAVRFAGRVTRRATEGICPSGGPCDRAASLWPVLGPGVPVIWTSCPPAAPFAPAGGKATEGTLPPGDRPLAHRTCWKRRLTLISRRSTGQPNSTHEAGRRRGSRISTRPRRTGCRKTTGAGRSEAVGRRPRTLHSKQSAAHPRRLRRRAGRPEAPLTPAGAGLRKESADRRCSALASQRATWRRSEGVPDQT